MTQNSSFLDEPFSGLDPVNAKVIGGVIHDLHNEGRTILFSTHVLHQAEANLQPNYHD